MTITIERFTNRSPLKFSNVTETPKVITLGNVAYFEIKQEETKHMFVLADICNFTVSN